MRYRLAPYYLSLTFFTVFVILISIVPQLVISRADPIDTNIIFFAEDTSNNPIPGSTSVAKNYDELFFESCDLWNTAPNISRIMYPNIFCRQANDYNVYVQNIIKYVSSQIIILYFITILLICTSRTFHFIHKIVIYLMILIFMIGICIDTSSLESQKSIHLFGDGKIYDVRGKIYDSVSYPIAFDDQFEQLCGKKNQYNNSWVTFDSCEQINMMPYNAMVTKLSSLLLVIVSIVVVIYLERHNKDADLTIIPLDDRIPRSGYGTIPKFRNEFENTKPLIGVPRHGYVSTFQDEPIIVRL